MDNQGHVFTFFTFESWSTFDLSPFITTSPNKSLNGFSKLNNVSKAFFIDVDSINAQIRICINVLKRKPLVCFQETAIILFVKTCVLPLKVLRLLVVQVIFYLCNSDFSGFDF